MYDSSLYDTALTPDFIFVEFEPEGFRRNYGSPTNPPVTSAAAWKRKSDDLDIPQPKRIKRMPHRSFAKDFEMLIDTPSSSSSCACNSYTSTTPPQSSSCLNSIANNCPVCQEFEVTEIYRCFNGQIMCRGCHAIIGICPTWEYPDGKRWCSTLLAMGQFCCACHSGFSQSAIKVANSPIPSIDDMEDYAQIA
jgi:hypothetical protein|uniref:Uncharacterized protein n=1 Tax=Eutreptiella gymnastica TaxID=73025 RepID=A0A7S4LBK0_9EUGL